MKFAVKPWTREQLSLTIETYETDATTEHFLSFETADDDKLGRRIAAFLRLSFPHQAKPHLLSELEKHAMIREVHVYGPALALGKSGDGEAQHIGLGTELVQKAMHMAAENGYPFIAVISAIGTQKYYEKHGFQLNGLYMTAASNSRLT